VPVWGLDLTEPLQGVQSELAKCARMAIGELPAGDRPFRQSQANLTSRFDAFAELGAMLLEVVNAVTVATTEQHRSERPPALKSINCWSLEIEDQAAWDLEAQRLRIYHSHPGSTMSSVLFLDGDEIPDGAGGTMFRSPLAHVADPRLMPPVVTVPWRSLHLLIFPSWLEHGPARPGSACRSRITIAADFRL